ncbi:MAG: hypothetical protein MJ252_19210 [archaeon]|nr:hypothetical protein [archaeon]
MKNNNLHSNQSSSSSLDELAMGDSEIIFSNVEKEQKDSELLLNIFNTEEDKKEENPKEEIKEVNFKEELKEEKEMNTLRIENPQQNIIDPNIINHLQLNQIRPNNPPLDNFMIPNVIPNYEVFLNNPQIAVSYINDFKGSLIFQRMLGTLDAIQIDKIFKSLSNYYNEIMCSKHGNYFFQKLVSYLNGHQITQLLMNIKSNFVNISSDKFGTHSIQAVIKFIKGDEELSVFNTIIEENIVRLMSNEFSYHIILEMIRLIPENKRNFFNNFIINNVDKVSSYAMGCSCVKKFIYFNSNFGLRMNLINALRIKFRNMVVNRFSNSILILAVNVFGIEPCHFIIDEIKNNLLFFVNMEGFAINFVEKVILIMSKLDKKSFNELALRCFQNQTQFSFLISTNKGKNLLKTIYNNSPFNFQQIYAYHKSFLDRA